MKNPSPKSQMGQQHRKDVTKLVYYINRFQHPSPTSVKPFGFVLVGTLGRRGVLPLVLNALNLALLILVHFLNYPD